MGHLDIMGYLPHLDATAHSSRPRIIIRRFLTIIWTSVQTRSITSLCVRNKYINTINGPKKLKIKRDWVRYLLKGHSDIKQLKLCLPQVETYSSYIIYVLIISQRARPEHRAQSTSAMVALYTLEKSWFIIVSSPVKWFQWYRICNIEKSFVVLQTTKYGNLVVCVSHNQSGHTSYHGRFSRQNLWSLGSRCEGYRRPIFILLRIL